jgi:hypothetical protein
VVTKANAAGLSEVDLPWADVNGDGFVQPNEVDRSTVLYTLNYDPANPGSVSSPNVVDPTLTPPKTDEIIVGFDHELMRDFAVGGSYIYKRFSKMIWQDWPYAPGSALAGVYYPFPGLGSSDFVPVTTNFQGQTLTYYQLAPGITKTGDLVTNRPDYHQRYQGIEITANKRLSHRWLFDTGFTYAVQREFFESDRAIFDPTNIDLRRGGEVANSTQGSGKSGYFLDSRWNFKLDGMVELPYGVRLAGKLNGRQGFPFLRSFRTDNRGQGIGRVEVLLDPVGDSRLKDLWITDLRAEKVFDIGHAQISGIVDGFNVFNSATVLKEERRQNFLTANRIEDILSARVVRFGARLTF